MSGLLLAFYSAGIGLDPMGQGERNILQDALIIVLACLAVGVLLCFFAIRYTQQRRTTRKRKRISRHPAKPEEAHPPEEPASPHRHRRRRRQRREHRPHNPTLAETGGLPPKRNEDSTSSPE